MRRRPVGPPQAHPPVHPPLPSPSRARPAEKAAARAGFGGERYEVPAFQAAVRGVFDRLAAEAAAQAGPSGAPLWRAVDASGSIEEVEARVAAEVQPLLQAVAAGGEPVRALWAGEPLAL